MVWIQAKDRQDTLAYINESNISQIFHTNEHDNMVQVKLNNGDFYWLPCDVVSCLLVNGTVEHLYDGEDGHIGGKDNTWNDKQDERFDLEKEETEYKKEGVENE